MAQQSNKSDNVKIALYLFGGYLLWRVAKNFIGREDDSQTAPEAMNCDSVLNSPNLSRDRAAYFNDADEIVAAIQGTGVIVLPWEDDAKIAAILMRAGNETDVKALICAFGNRKPTILSPAQPLGSWVSAYLDSDKISEVNNYYQYKGISFRF